MRKEKKDNGHKIVDIYIADLKRRDAKQIKILSSRIYLNKFYDYIKKKGIQNYRYISKDDILDYRHYLINDYISKKTNKRLSNASINIYITWLTNHFDWLKKTGRRKDNPCKDLPIKFRLPGSWTEDSVKYLEPYEINKLKDFFKKKTHAQESILLTRLTFEEGLRISEALGLNVNDIDLNNNTIKISKSLGRLGRIERTPKSKKSNRTITVPSSLIEDITTYINAEGKTPAGRLFDHDYHTYRKRINTADKNLKFRHKLTWHLGRHSAATNMLAAGIPIYAVQRHLGHEKIETTEKYLHLVESKKTEYAELRESYYQNGNGKPKPKEGKLSTIRELFSGLSKEDRIKLVAELIG